MLLGRSPAGDSPAVVRWIALFVAVVAIAFCGVQVVEAVRAQHSGTATYRYGPRGILREQVSIHDQPQKYQESINKLYFTAGAAGLISYVAFLFFRKLGE